MCGNGWMWTGGMGWGGWILIAVVMTVFFALVITAVVAAARYVSGGQHPTSSNSKPQQAPEDVLAERFRQR